MPDSPSADARYWQIEFALSSERLDALEDLLWEAGALSVSAVPGADAPDLFEPDPGAMPLWQGLQVLALFASSEAADAASAIVAAACAPDAPTIRLGCVEEDDWQHAWRQHVNPVCFADRLWICPTGARTPAMGDAVVMLDAGLAFGTGAHATTALCLEWLALHPPRAARVVDFGCGSGILGIAALVLGAADVRALDHDPQAHLATRENAERNGVADRLRLVDAGALAPGAADVLLANILAGTLIELAPLLRPLVAPDGALLLSGVLAHQAAAVREAYPDFEFAPTLQRDEWVCLAARRRASGSTADVSA